MLQILNSNYFNSKTRNKIFKMDDNKMDKRYVITRYLAGDPDSTHTAAKGYNAGNFIRNIISGDLFYTTKDGIHVNVTNQNSSLNDNHIFRHASLANMKQAMYRNLEGDNMLPTADYAGRIRPIQTPITLISSDDGYLA